MEMIQSLVVVVIKFSSEVQQLRIDNETLKMQLRDLQQVPSHVPYTRLEAANNTAKSYRDVVCTVGGNPEAAVVPAPARISLPERSVVSGDNHSDCDFLTVVRKKRVTPSPVSTAAFANTTKKPRIAIIGVRSSSSISVVQKGVCGKSLFVSQFSPDVANL
jgi:hypothetical protein